MASDRSVGEIIIVSQRRPQAYVAASAMVEMERRATWLAKYTGTAGDDGGRGSVHGIGRVFALDGPPTTPLPWIFYLFFFSSSVRWNVFCRRLSGDG